MTATLSHHITTIPVIPALQQSMLTFILRHELEYAVSRRGTMSWGSMWLTAPGGLVHAFEFLTPSGMRDMDPEARESHDFLLTLEEVISHADAGRLIHIWIERYHPEAKGKPVRLAYHTDIGRDLLTNPLPPWEEARAGYLMTAPEVLVGFDEPSYHAMAASREEAILSVGPFAEHFLCRIKDLPLATRVEGEPGSLAAIKAQSIRHLRSLGVSQPIVWRE